MHKRVIVAGAMAALVGAMGGISCAGEETGEPAPEMDTVGPVGGGSDLDPGSDPEDPSADPEPDDPADPNADPTDPNAAPNDPNADPTDPASDPTDPNTAPNDPNADPADPASDPTDPSSDPTPDPMDPNPEPMDCNWDLSKPDRCPVCPGTETCSGSSYTDNGDGTVTSSCCGLVWQRDVPAEVFSLPEAEAYCAGLELAGGGWRLPSVAELVTLVLVLDRTPVEPTIDRMAFPDTPPSWYWSSSETEQPHWGWVIHFRLGKAATFGTSTAGNVRCVR